MEQLYFPQVDWIIDAVHERILPLPGYAPVTTQTTGEILRKNRLGV
jgi:2-oxoisovalerate dehydrogenase E1 component